MDQGDFRVPVATTRSQNNDSSIGNEGRPHSALASINVTRSEDSTTIAIANGVGLIGDNKNNHSSDSLCDGIQPVTDKGTSEEELRDTNDNLAATDESNFSNGGNENSKACVSSVNKLNTNGFITKLSKVRNSTASKSSAQDPSLKSTTDHLPTLDLTHNLPPLTETITQGFGVKMVASSACQQLIYRSVPPRPLSYALTDVLDTNKSSRLRSKTAPVSTNSPEEYVQRFKSRPTTRPKVVEFDGSTVSSKTKRCAIGAAFPTAKAKVYIGHHKTSPFSDSPGGRSPSSKLHLAPLQHTGPQPPTGFVSHAPRSVRTARSQGAVSQRGGAAQGATSTSRTFTRSANSSSSPGQAPKSSTSAKQSENMRSAEFITTVNRVSSPEVDDHIHNPDLLLTSSTDCDDLSILPRPKKVLPRREVPWVFRYKVKKGMNTLSRIMASRPAQNVLHSSYTFT